MIYYIERDGIPVSVAREEYFTHVKEPDYHERRRIGWDEIGVYLVSTVFLAIEHGMGPDGSLLYETMIFPKEELTEFACERYSTREAACFGHMRMCHLAMTNHYHLEYLAWEARRA